MVRIRRECGRAGDENVDDRLRPLRLSRAGVASADLLAGYRPGAAKELYELLLRGEKEEAPFTLEYKDRLGAVSVSKTGVVNFQAAEDFDAAMLAEMLRALDAGLKKQERAVSFGRLAASPRFARRGEGGREAAG
jgi:hypothetical protein